MRKVELRDIAREDFDGERLLMFAGHEDQRLVQLADTAPPTRQATRKSASTVLV
jgi:hypothetical protein